MTYFDSTGNYRLQVGHIVKFRGRDYTIKCFHPGEGRNSTARIEFEEPQHVEESADELSVDFVSGVVGEEPPEGFSNLIIDVAEQILDRIEKRMKHKPQGKVHIIHTPTQNDFIGKRVKESKCQKNQ